MVYNRHSLGKMLSPNRKGRGMVKKKAQRVAETAEMCTSMQVVVRVRPPNERELQSNARKIIEIVDEHCLVFDAMEPEDPFVYHGSKQLNRDVTKRKFKNAEFSFDQVFSETATNLEVYESSTRDILNVLFDGYNCSVFAYGATGSGKTFTMLGNKENPGIAYLTMLELYNKVHELSEEYEFDVRVSYLEVYNENVRDLLKPESKHLHLREDPITGVTVANLTFSKISCADELFAQLTQGNLNRTQHPTDSNAESSRSHAVFQVYIHSRRKTTKQQKLVKLSMIDLAGSEKASATGGRGARFAEGQNINRSLLALGNCINSLSAGSKHVPYRDSKLTRLLKDSLGGNCKTVMIANVSPCSTTYEDTHSTLKYAERAKMIKLKVAKNIVATNLSRVQHAKLVEMLQKENTTLRNELLLLKKRYEGGQSSDVEPVVNTEVKGVECPVPACVNKDDAVLPSGNNPSQATDFPPVPVVKLEEMAHVPVEVVLKCDKEVQVCFPVLEESKPDKLLSEVKTVFAVKKGLYHKLSCDERKLKQLQWCCCKRLITTRRLNILGSDHKELEKRESRMRSCVNAALSQAREHHENMNRHWQQLEAQRSNEAAVLSKAQAVGDHTIDTFVAKSQLEVAVQSRDFQIDHMKELVKIMHTQYVKDDAVIRTLCGTVKSQHMLLKAYGKVTDAMSQEYKGCLRMLEGVKVVTFVGMTEDSEKAKDELASTLSLLWENEQTWNCNSRGLFSEYFDQWCERMKNLLDEVERNSAKRESVAYGCTPVKLNMTFCKEMHDTSVSEGAKDLESTFILGVASESVDSTKKLVEPETRPPQRPLSMLPANQFGFRTAANVEFATMYDLGEQNKENRDAVFKKPVATPGKPVKKQLKYSGSPRPVLAVRNATVNVSNSRVPLKLRNEASSIGLKFPTLKPKTPMPRFHPYRGPESVPRTRSSKLQKKSSF